MNTFKFEGYTYDLPEWVGEHELNCYISKVVNDSDFAERVLLYLLQKSKDSYPCCDLQKFLESWTFGINVMD